MLLFGVTDPDLIREAIATSGLSARRFAECITWRDERTIRRWVSGDPDIKMPETARSRLVWFLALPKRERDRMVAIATRTAT